MPTVTKGSRRSIEDVVEVKTKDVYCRSIIKNPPKNSCELCPQKGPDRDHYANHLEELILPKGGWEKQNFCRLFVSIKFDLDEASLLFHIRNDVLEPIRLKKIFILNNVNSVTDADCGAKRLQKGDFLEILSGLENIHINGYNALIIIYETNQEVLECYNFHVISGRLESEPLKIVSVQNRSFKRRMKIPPLKEYPASMVAKELVKRNFRINPNETKAEKDLRELLLHFRPENLNANNYIEMFSYFLQIEDAENALSENRFRKKSRVLNIRRNIYKIPLQTLSDLPFLTEGDRIWFVATTGKHRFYCTIHKIIKSYILVRSNNKLNTKMEYEIHFVYNRMMIQLQHFALELAATQNIVPFLFPENVNKKEKSPKLPKLQFRNKSIANNPEQQNAVANICFGNYHPAPYILFGPPGTGKTCTIVESVCQIVQQNRNNNVLICAMSNSVCDEIAWQVDQFAARDHRRILRLYAPNSTKKSTRIDIIDISNCRDGIYPDLSIIYEYRIIVCTLGVCGRLAQAGIRSDFFSHCFIDECEYVTEPLSLIPIAGICSSNGKLNANIILCGDPNQLGPIVKSTAFDKTGLLDSLLYRLMSYEMYQANPKTKQYDSRVLTQLVNNYRSHEAIVKLPNDMLYDGNIKICADPNVTDWALNLNLLGGNKFPIIFEDYRGYCDQENDGYSWYNDGEIERILFYIQYLLDNKQRKIRPIDIGVIAPYRCQVTKIQEKLQKMKKTEVMVGSVEQFQGREKPVIIVSLVRSVKNNSKKSVKSNLGFLDDPRRWNVIITRAQALLIVVGNLEILQNNPNWSEFIKYVKQNDGYRMYIFPPKESKI